MDVLVNKGVFKMHEVFLDELRKLNTRFMGMGIDVSEAIEEATQAFVEMNIDKTNKIAISENQIDDIAKQIQTNMPVLLAKKLTLFRLVLNN